MPKASVIVPNYNHARFLRQRIDSILNQTFRDFELIILDDCSTDNSREIIESYRNSFDSIKMVFNSQNSGSAFKQWDMGISLAIGDYIWIAESDDYSDPRFLEECVARMLENNIGLVFSHSLEINEATGSRSLSFSDSIRFGNDFQNSYFNTGRSEIQKRLVYENTIPNASGVLFLKSLYLEVGGTDKQMRLCGDWFLWIKLLLKSNLYFIAQPLNYFRYTPTSLGLRLTKRDTFHERLKILRLLHENGFKMEVKEVEKALISDIFNSFKVVEILKGFQLAYKNRGIISYPLNCFRGFFSSLISRLNSKLNSR